MSVFAKVGDAFKSLATFKIFIRKDVKCTNETCSNYYGLAYVNYLKSSGICYGVDNTLTSDVRNGLHAYSFEEALLKVEATAKKEHAKKSFRPFVPLIVKDVKNLLDKLSAVEAKFFIQEVDKIHDRLHTIASQIDQQTDLFCDPLSNALVHCLIHSMIFSETDYLLHCHSELIQFVADYELSIALPLASTKD